MALRSVITFLLVSVLTATLPHPDGFARGSARFPGGPAVLARHFHSFHSQRLAHRFSGAPFLGTDIGDLTDGYAEYAGPSFDIEPPVSPVLGREPPAADLPLCNDTGPGGVKVMRGGACEHGHPSPHRHR